jgi:hypothetical protein
MSRPHIGRRTEGLYWNIPNSLKRERAKTLSRISGCSERLTNGHLLSKRRQARVKQLQLLWLGYGDAFTMNLQVMKQPQGG